MIDQEEILNVMNLINQNMVDNMIEIQLKVRKSSQTRMVINHGEIQKMILRDIQEKKHQNKKLDVKNVKK